MAIHIEGDPWRGPQLTMPQRVINLQLALAFKEGASVLEFVPGPEGGNLWLLTAGEPVALLTPPAHLVPGMIAELARLAGTDMPKTSSPAHGRFCIPSHFVNSFDPDRPRFVRIVITQDRYRLIPEFSDVGAQKDVGP